MSQRGPSRRRRFKSSFTKRRTNALAWVFLTFQQMAVGHLQKRVQVQVCHRLLWEAPLFFQAQWVLPASSTPPVSHPVSVSSASCHGQSVIPLMRSVLPSSPWHFYSVLPTQAFPPGYLIPDVLSRTLFTSLNLRSIYSGCFTDSFASVYYPLPYNKGKANKWECVPHFMGRNAEQKITGFGKMCPSLGRYPD